jgi:hypothetical protein
MRLFWKMTSLVFGFAFVASTVVYAGGSSIYSRYGLGEIRFPTSVRLQGMGGVSIGPLSPTDVNRINPASWSVLSTVRLSGSYMYEGLSTTDGINSAYFTGGNFDGVLLAFPIAKDEGVTLSVGFTPFSDVGYEVKTPTTINDVKTDFIYSGSGGLSTGVVGLSYTPLNNLHLGASLNYLVGTIDNAVDVNFDNPEYVATSNVRSTNIKGVNFTLGTVYSGIRNFTLGAVFSTGSDLSASRETVIRHISTNTRDTIRSDDGTVHLPVAYGFGLSYLLKERYLFGVDYYTQDWNSFSAYGVKAPEIRSSRQFGVGMEILPGKEATSLWGRLAYRLGAFYNETYYQLKGEPLNELFFTAGIGVPVSHNARIDVSLAYGTRGTDVKGLQKDNIFRLSVGLSAGELWFVTKED